MLKPMLASALFAGLIAGLFAAVLQQALLVPLIQQAELYESGVLTHFDAAAHDHGAGDHGHGHAAAGGESDATRTLLTVLMTVLTTCGFGLVLVAGFAFAERLRLVRIDLLNGLLFGLAGFTATQLLPAMGLSPELPGAAAAELGQRQIWWLFTVMGGLGGMALIAWGNLATKLAGVAIALAPHLMGAPQPEGYSGVVPPELSALYAARVLAVGGFSWAALGALAGYFWSRETAQQG